MKLLFGGPGLPPEPTPNPAPAPRPAPGPAPRPPPPVDPPPDRSKRSINLDTSAALALIEEGSTQRDKLLLHINNREMIMCTTAFGELQTAVNHFAGPLEQDRANRLMHRISLV